MLEQIEMFPESKENRMIKSELSSTENFKTSLKKLLSHSTLSKKETERIKNRKFDRADWDMLFK